jgi:hypothetical protein
LHTNVFSTQSKENESQFYSIILSKTTNFHLSRLHRNSFYNISSCCEVGRKIKYSCPTKWEIKAHYFSSPWLLNWVKLSEGQRGKMSREDERYQALSRSDCFNISTGFFGESHCRLSCGAKTTYQHTFLGPCTKSNYFSSIHIAVWLVHKFQNLL